MVQTRVRAGRPSAGTAPSGPGSVPVGPWCAEAELSGDLAGDCSGDTAVSAPVPFAGQGEARLLVRLHGEPLGYLTLPVAASGAIDPAAIREQALTRWPERIATHLAAEHPTSEERDLAGPAGWLPAALAAHPSAGCPQRAGLARHADTFVSVVVCTRDRAAALPACLAGLGALTHPRLEVLVVDNAPTGTDTFELVADLARRDPRFRYVLEPLPGLSRARNRGLAEARGDIVAMTDDDVLVDPDWVQGLLRGFDRAPGTGCVTGLVATASVQGQAEEYFDARTASWSTRTEVEVFDLAGDDRPGTVFPYSPGIFGTGANVALDRAMMLGLGGFDVALGAGSRTRGGEDLDLFVRVLRAGRALVYEPSAVVWHHHRADPSALRRQMYGYGTGLSAFLTKCLLQRGTRGEVLRRVPGGIRRAAGIRAEATQQGRASGSPSSRLLGVEALGLLAGPWLYLGARWHTGGRRLPRRGERSAAAPRARLTGPEPVGILQGAPGSAAGDQPQRGRPDGGTQQHEGAWGPDDQR